VCTAVVVRVCVCLCESACERHMGAGAWVCDCGELRVCGWWGVWGWLCVFAWRVGCACCPSLKEAPSELTDTVGSLGWAVWRAGPLHPDVRVRVAEAREGNLKLTDYSWILMLCNSRMKTFVLNPSR
jgi:hypothetical protein